jgi:predicted O-methyltransferase YrrM
MPLTADSIAALDILPGCSIATVAIPLDYPPSRDMRVRWGGERTIPGLAAWVSSEAEAYSAFLGTMRTYAADMAAIPLLWGPERNEAVWLETALSPFDAAALYTMIRSHRPARYVEVGSGVSTLFARRAISDGDLPTTIYSIDPAPRASVEAACDVNVRTSLEEADLTVFETLEAGDILFIDGSHRAFMNSDVTVFFLEVLPRIRPDVLIHVHDISLPWDYPPEYVDWYWNEQYMLATWIQAAPDRVKPLFPAFYLCHMPRFAAEMLEPFATHWPEGSWRGGGSFWFTKR